MSRAAPLFAFALSLLALAPTARAQDVSDLPATFTSDRPGFANTSGVAARGRLTTELGVSAGFDDDTQVGVLPNLSMRVGVFDWLELRVRGPNAVGVFGALGDTFGIDDPVVGFKIGGPLHETLSISSVWEVSAPLGTDGFGAPEATWRADIQADWNFWGPLTLTPNAVASVQAGVDPLSGETARFFEGGVSLKLTWAILDVLAVFVQSYVLAAEDVPAAQVLALDEWRVQVGGGLMWMVAPNVQVDASFDTRVTDQGVPPTPAIGTTILW
jgi:hypothetical protein